jgi:hypothetical protein
MEDRNSRFRYQLLAALFLIFFFGSFSIGQTVQSEAEAQVIVPDYAMEQVVQRVLVWYFKPRTQHLTVYLSDQRIKQNWLPTVKNVEFRLLSNDEIKRRSLKAYFFY